jgi:type IV secretory pathway VirB10-like protein
VSLRFISAVLILSAAVSFAQQSPPCPATRPVDDIIAEVNRQQSKKANRNKNPFPSTGCIFGWCREAKTPPTIPQPSTNPESASPPPNTSTTDDSSSKTEQDRCREAMEKTLEAAHNVDVGDFQMTEKHYAAALSRYQEAADEKPGDAATAAAKLATPEKWVKEAQTALARLQRAGNK